MGLITSGKTDVGLKRKSNQDSFFIGNEQRLFIVADGMGGHNGGDIASQMAIKLLPEVLSESLKKTPDKNPSVLLEEAISVTNNSLKSFSDSHSELVGMGTTLVSFFFKGQNVYIGNVGDSRAYLISQKKMFQLSRDHSMVQEKLNLGIYNRDQAALDPQKNILVRTVGFDPTVEVDVFTYKVIKNDIFLCCSDGVHGKVSDEDIIFLINECIPDPGQATQKMADQVISSLINLANENGGQDNSTAILIIAQ
jgi:protein phosphatase